MCLTAACRHQSPWSTLTRSCSFPSLHNTTQYNQVVFEFGPGELDGSDGGGGGGGGKKKKQKPSW